MVSTILAFCYTCDYYNIMQVFKELVYIFQCVIDDLFKTQPLVLYRNN